MQNIAYRLIASAAALVAYGAFVAFYSPGATIASADLAARQFDDSNTQSVASQTGMSILSGVGALATLIVLIVLIGVWWKPLRRALSRGMPAVAAVLVACGFLALPQQDAKAYYDKQDFTEAVTIYPNESAFWIPDTGASRDSQAQFDSEAYFNANKVATKRFVIPHQLLSGSGWGPFGNFYVPAGRLILVDRTPYNREWTKTAHRGTSSKDESFPCQDNDGHDVTVEITVGASVLEQNAAKFLYRFGVRPPPGDRTRPEVIFTSVYTDGRWSRPWIRWAAARCRSSSAPRSARARWTR